MTPSRARALRNVARYRALSIPEVAELANEVLDLQERAVRLSARLTALELERRELRLQLKQYVLKENP